MRVNGKARLHQRHQAHLPEVQKKSPAGMARPFACGARITPWTALKLHQLLGRYRRHRAYPETGTLFQTPPPWVGEPPTARPGSPSSCAQGRLEPGAVLFTVDAATHDDPLCVYPALHSIHGKSLFPRDSCILAIGKAAGTSRPPLDESQCGAFPFAESCLRQS